MQLRWLSMQSVLLLETPSALSAVQFQSSTQNSSWLNLKIVNIKFEIIALF